MVPSISSKSMSEHRSNRSSIRSNDHNNKSRYVISITEGENQYLVSVSVDGSHESQRHHKEVFI